MNDNPIATEQITALLDQGEESLLTTLGALLEPEFAQLPAEAALDKVYALLPEDQQALLRDKGAAYLRRQRHTLYERICTEWDYCGKRSQPQFGDAVTLVSWLIDTLTGVLLETPILVATVAVILVKVGLNQFCECEELEARRRAAAEDEQI